MLILLPPSETKAHGGNGAPLNWDELSFPALNPVRQDIAVDLAQLDVDKALEVLGISEKLRPEAESNTELFDSPTMPAIERFTGVLYDALDAATLPPAARARLAIGDALFGITRASDMIPHYRLSGGTKLPTKDGETPTLKSRWGRPSRSNSLRLRNQVSSSWTCARALTNSWASLNRRSPFAWSQSRRMARARSSRTSISITRASWHESWRSPR